MRADRHPPAHQAPCSTTTTHFLTLAAPPPHHTPCPPPHTLPPPHPPTPPTPPPAPPAAADFVRANRLAQGDTLAFCPHHDRMVLRTSLRADQLLPRTLKRGAAGAGAAGPAAKRRPSSAKAVAPALTHTPGWATPEPVLASSGGRKRHAASPPQASPFWQPGTSRAAEAAEALLFMHRWVWWVGGWAR